MESSISYQLLSEVPKNQIEDHETILRDRMLTLNRERPLNYQLHQFSYVAHYQTSSTRFYLEVYIPSAFLFYFQYCVIKAYGVAMNNNVAMAAFMGQKLSSA